MRRCEPCEVDGNFLNFCRNLGSHHPCKGDSDMKGSPIQGAEIHRHRALELIGLADKTTDENEAAELLALAAEQLELADGAPQQQPSPTRQGLSAPWSRP
jgi:hypothetical protein